MPNCKICGTPVTAANVFHSACWEKQVEKMPLTRGDRIRSMSDEELAAYIVELTDGVYCLHLEACYEDLHGDGEFPEERCRACAVKWLRSEADAKTTQSVPGI